jgi:hypothetical protein
MDIEGSLYGIPVYGLMNVSTFWTLIPTYFNYWPQYFIVKCQIDLISNLLIPLLVPCYTWSNKLYICPTLVWILIWEKTSIHCENKMLKCLKVNKTQFESHQFCILWISLSPFLQVDCMWKCFKGPKSMKLSHNYLRSIASYHFIPNIM